MSETQAQTQRVSAEDVKRVAELAYLELRHDEEVKMQRDLNAILGYIDQLNQVDTSSVEPMAQVAEILGGTSSALRADSPRPSLPRDHVMASAPETDGTFFKVPKVIER
ncbi:MAG TPA: Asp-tRNA(Asn)/Glu-tRNA(Gln) amidotransferase subunit GatC [Silvibacterium sp.]|nr:Asp-tRNA(Asn)/Glu-tRNA(Gln) amidotransferase subunit GatC [Silvibacterium sp.]